MVNTYIYEKYNKNEMRTRLSTLKPVDGLDFVKLHYVNGKSVSITALSETVYSARVETNSGTLYSVGSPDIVISSIDKIFRPLQLVPPSNEE